MEQYDWPGNVRELKNIVERTVVLSQDEKLALTELPEDLKSPSKHQNWSPESSNLQQMEKELIRLKLDECRGNKSKAAQKLGISRRTLYRKIDDYQIK